MLKLLSVLVFAAAAQLNSLPPLVENEMEEAEHSQAAISPLRRLRGRGQVALASSEESHVVCPTFLEPSIQREQLARYVGAAGVDPVGFVNVTKSWCYTHGGFPENPEKRPSYGGTWAAMGMPSEADMKTLLFLSDWVKKQQETGRADKKTWDKFAKPNNGASAGNLAFHVANHPTKISMEGPPRLLDFGCGSGQDLAAMKNSFGATKENSFCLDIFKASLSDVTAYALDPNSVESYRRSLEQVLKFTENSIHVAMSMVTFHHITGTMRTDALSFIAKSLAPGGIFLMAEWDNSPTDGVPSREVYYDINHFLPNVVLTSHFFPSDASALKLGTEYLSVAAWKSQASAAGLAYDADRSKIVKVNGTRLLPEELAESSFAMNRDAFLVFGKASHS